MALRQSVGDMAATLVSIVRTRIELFSLEAYDQKARLVRLLCMILGAFVCIAMAVLVFSLTIALYFWPSDYRYLALWLLVLLYVVIALVLLLGIRRAVASEPVPFAATIDELRRDAAMIGRLGDPEPDAASLSRPGPRVGEPS